MDLRRVLVEYRLSQTKVAFTATSLGHRLHASQVSATVSHLIDANPMCRAAIRAGLAALGVPEAVISGIPEIAPRDMGWPKKKAVD